MSVFTCLTDDLILRILECFQTKKMISENRSEYETKQIILRTRKNLVNGKGIKTDLKTILSLSMTCSKFYNIINNSDIGKLILTIYYNSSDIKIDNLEHISFCKNNMCKNICHYVNKDIKHGSILKKIALRSFNEKKKTVHKNDLSNLYKYHLTDKQIEAYYRIKKMIEK